MADTIQVVLWALGQKCPLRQGTDWEKPATAIKTLADCRTYSRLRTREGRGFGGLDRLPLLEPGGSFVQCKGVQLTLPANIEARLSPQSTALHLAIGLFVSDEATLGQVAEVAGLSQAEFLRELGKRRIPIHYGAEELAEDLRAVESLAAR